MKIDLSEIARTPGGNAVHDIDMTFTEIEGMTVTAPVRGELTISSTGNVLLLTGAVDTELAMECNRCSIVYSQPVHAEIQEDFVVHPAVRNGAPTSIEEDDVAPEMRLFVPGTLDLNLDELLRQSILVAIPLQTLCTDDCRGLCPQCGHPLNEGPCDCTPDTINPQLAELQRLFEERQRDAQ